MSPDKHQILSDTSTISTKARKRRVRQAAGATIRKKPCPNTSKSSSNVVREERRTWYKRPCLMALASTSAKPLTAFTDQPDSVLEFDREGERLADVASSGRQQDEQFVNDGLSASAGIYDRIRQDPFKFANDGIWLTDQDRHFIHELLQTPSEKGTGNSELAMDRRPNPQRASLPLEYHRIIFSPYFSRPDHSTSSSVTGQSNPAGIISNHEDDHASPPGIVIPHLPELDDDDSHHNEAYSPKKLQLRSPAILSEVSYSSIGSIDGPPGDRKARSLL